MATFAKGCYDFSRRQGMNFLPDWNYFSEAYIKDYQEHEKQYRPTKKERKTIAEEVAWLNSLKPIEQASFQRADDAELFAGHWRDIEDYWSNRPSCLKEVQFRDGWLDLLRQVVPLRNSYAEPSGYGSRFEIVSVNWSREFILRTQDERVVADFPNDDDARTAPLRVATSAGESLNLPPVKYNNLKFSGSRKRLFTSGDKLTAFTADHDCYGNKDPIGAHGVRVYVGDSVTDLECLLCAHLPVCIQENPLRYAQQDLAETLARLDISTKQLSHFDATDLADLKKSLQEVAWPPASPRKQTVYAISDFTELSAWLDVWYEELDEAGMP